jgi:hypothetical protein
MRLRFFVWQDENRYYGEEVFVQESKSNVVPQINAFVWLEKTGKGYRVKDICYSYGKETCDFIDVMTVEEKLEV